MNRPDALSELAALSAELAAAELRARPVKRIRITTLAPERSVIAVPFLEPDDDLAAAFAGAGPMELLMHPADWASLLKSPELKGDLPHTVFGIRVVRDRSAQEWADR